MKKLLALVTALVFLGTSVAVAHQPVVLLNSDTTAAKGPLLVDGTVSFAIRASFNKTGEKKAFRAQLKEGDTLSVQYLIVDKKPENSLKNTQLPSVAITGPGGFKLSMKINERTNFYEPYTGTNYLYLARFSAVAKTGIYNFLITAKTKSSITLGVGDRETRGEVVRGPYVVPTPQVTAKPTPSPTATPIPTPKPTPSPTPTPTPTPTVTPPPTPTPSPTPTPTSTVAPSPTPTPTSTVAPSPTPTPTPTSTLTVAQKWNATGSRAMEGYENAFPLKSAQFPELETIWRISEAVNPLISAEIQKQYKESIKFWSAYTKHGSALQVIVENLDDLEFICKWRNTYLEMQDTSCTSAFRQDKTRTWDAHTTQVADRGTDFYFMTDPKTLQDPSFWPRVPHEFFHNVQFAQTPRYKFVLPCWAEEGGAEFFGIMIASQGTPEKFLSMRVNLMKDRNGKIKQSQLAQSDWKSWLLGADTTSIAEGKSGWGCESVSMEGIYSYGFMATEYLNLKLGTSGLLALYRDAGVLGWDKAIEKAFDKSKSDAYDEIALYMKQEYEIGISQKVFS